MSLDPDPRTASGKGHRGFRHLVSATRNSMSGLALAFRHEAAFRHDLLLAAVLIPLAFAIEVAAAERVLLIGSVLFVLAVELLNSGIESAIDRIGPEMHELSRRAKDYGSAAVFVSLATLATTWLLVAGPVLWAAIASR